MNAILIKIVPVIIIGVIGYLFRRKGIFKHEHGDVFLKIVFYLALPALVIISVADIDLTYDLIYLPVISAAIIFVIYIVSYVTGTLMKLSGKAMGVLLTGTLIMNTGFLLPFVIAAYGEEGLARMTLFDFSNGFLAFTFVYFLACKYGGKDKGSKVMIRKFLLAPPIWALIIGIVLNLANITVSGLFHELFKLLGNLTIPLIMLSLGIYFNPKIVNIKPVVSAIIIRMFFGLLLGYVFVNLFNIEGLNRILVLLGSAAPVGYNTLTFASLEDLDKEYAASLVSYSILVGVFMVPAMILILG